MNNNFALCSPRETFYLTLALLTNRIFTNYPLIYTKTSGNGAPLSVLLSEIFVLIAVSFLSTRFFNFKNGNILSAVRNKFGKTATYLLSSAIIFYLLLSSFYLLTEITDFAKLVAFPTAPFWFIAVFFVLAAVVGASGGSKTLFRASGFITLFFIFSGLIIILSVLFQSDFTNLFPLMGTGISNTVGKGFSGISMYADILLLLLIKPDSSDPKPFRRAVIWASVAALAFNLLVILTYTAKIPYPISAQEQFPAYLLMKEVYFGRFFQRMDAIFLLSTCLCGMFSLSLNILILSGLLKQVFGITHRYISVYSTAFLLFFTAAIPFRLPVHLLVWSALSMFGIFLTAAIFYRKERIRTHEK